MKLIDISTPKYPNTFTMVDDEDFDYLNQWKWTYSQYANRWTQHKNIKKKIYMHAEINKTAKNMLTDHIDGNKLNNQKKNLRTASRSQNNQNRRYRTSKFASRFSGVSWDKRESKWIAHIKKDKKRIRLGGFRNEIDAAAAYNTAAKRYYGKFACLNVFDTVNGFGG